MSGLADWHLSEAELQELLQVGDKHGISRKDAEDLFIAVARAGSWESCSWDFIEGVDAVLAAGFRRRDTAAGHDTPSQE